MEESKKKCERISQLIDEIINLITNERGYNSFEDLKKSKKIMSQKNINQINIVKKKLDNFTMILYNQRFSNDEEIIERLNKIYVMIDDLIE